MINLDFKRNEEGDLYFIEANYRVGFDNALATALGINLPYLSYQDMQGKEISFKENNISGARWVSEFSDLKAIQKQQISLDDIIEGYKNVKATAIFDAEDTGPFLAKLRGYFP